MPRTGVGLGVSVGVSVGVRKPGCDVFAANITLFKIYCILVLIWDLDIGIWYLFPSFYYL